MQAWPRLSEVKTKPCSNHLVLNVKTQNACQKPLQMLTFKAEETSTVKGLIRCILEVEKDYHSSNHYEENKASTQFQTLNKSIVSIVCWIKTNCVGAHYCMCEWAHAPCCLIWITFAVAVSNLHHAQNEVTVHWFHSSSLNKKYIFMSLESITLKGCVLGVEAVSLAGVPD